MSDSKKAGEIADFPPLIVGGAVFNTQYSEDPTKLPITDIIVSAFEQGMNALDTSPYYGKSEELIGSALGNIKEEWPRESYFICTKAGRIQLDEFDYSRTWVRQSVLRSLERLKTTYLDLVYMHDIEFVPEDQIYDALRELAQLKKEGVINNIGVSGYPVKLLLDVCIQCKGLKDIGPLDAVLSYSNGCIQNTILFDLYERFIVDGGIKKLMNGSILSMSLLRSGVTHSFHPAPQALKDRVNEIAQRLLEQDIELADLATRFALHRWLFLTKEQTEKQLEWNKKTSVVLGVSNVEELNVALEALRLVEKGVSEEEETLFKRVISELGPNHYNETWSSGRY